MKENLARILKHMVILLVGSALTGTLLLVLVFCIPTGIIQKHVAESVDTMIPGEELPSNAFLRHIWQNKES